MAKRESRDMEVDEDWEDLSECSGFLDESGNEKILQGRQKSRSNSEEEEDTYYETPLCQEVKENIEVNLAELGGDMTYQTKSLASLARIEFPEDIFEDAKSDLSPDAMTAPGISKTLCNNCLKLSDPIDNPKNEDSNVYIPPPIRDSNDDNAGQHEKYCTGCNTPLGSADGKLHVKNPENANTHRVGIEQILREMSDRQSEAVNKLDAMDYQSTEFILRTETLRNDINRRRDELKELVDKHADSLIVELDSWREEVSKVQGSEMETLRRYLDSLDNYKANCKGILEYGSPGDIQEVVADLEKEGAEWRQLPKDGFQGLFHAFRVTLKKTNIEEFLTAYYNNNDNNIIGVLEDESDIQDFEQIFEEKKLPSTNDFRTKRTRIEKFSKESRHLDIKGEREEPVLVGTMRTRAAEKEDKGILGVAFLDDELFVVSRQSSEVEVFDCRRFIFSCELDLDCLLNPEDIGSCANKKCLYIMDRKNDRSRSEILRVDRDGNLIKRWSTGGQCGRISVTPESNVLLCMYKTTTLNEYSADGVLLRLIQFSPEAGLEHPRHAIKLTSGYFLVGHGEIGDAVHRVMKVDSRGKVVGSFPGPSEASEGNETMKRPFYLALDPEGQNVLVADADNKRVLMLNYAMEFKRELLSAERHGLRYPARICIDASRGLLFVADNKVEDKRILVFLIK